MGSTWILTAVCFLAVCTTGNLASGKDSKISPDVNKTSPYSHASAERNIEGVKNESVKMGTNVTLLCTESKIALKEIFFVIWNISLQHKSCRITTAVNDIEYDTCQDGKKLEYDQQGHYYLTIPNFSLKDEGNYTCDISYRAGGYITRIIVFAWAHPRLSSRLIREQGHIVAVCVAADGKPAASIHWETTWDSPFNSTDLVWTERGLFIVKSCLRLPQIYSRMNITCVATVSHPNQTTIRIHPDDLETLKWPFILLAVCATCITVALLTVFYLMRERLLQLSIFRKVYCESKSSAPIEEKVPQPRDLEEVEPYASYVQRVNSIYNSSAELFNA